MRRFEEQDKLILCDLIISQGFHVTALTVANVAGMFVELFFFFSSTHSDVEDGDYVEGRGEDGAHALDGRLVQAVVGRQHLPVRDKQPNDNTTSAC